MIAKKEEEQAKHAHEHVLAGDIVGVAYEAIVETGEGEFEASGIQLVSVEDFAAKIDQSLRDQRLRIYGFEIQYRMLQVLVSELRGKRTFNHKLASRGLFKDEAIMIDPVPSGIPVDAILAIITNDTVNLGQLRETNEGLEKEVALVEAVCHALRYF